MQVEMNNQEAEMKKDVLRFVSFQPKRDSASDARSALLVVAGLIFTLTFEKGTEVPDHITERPLKDLYVIILTLGFSASCTMLEYLTNGFPLQRELRIAIYSVSTAYGMGSVGQVQGQIAKGFLYLALATPFLVRAIPRMARWLVNKTRTKNKPDMTSEV